MAETFERDHFAKICEMMRSDNVHERAVAAERATTYLGRFGMTWSSFIAIGSTPGSTASRTSARPFYSSPPPPPTKARQAAHD
ncbi:MAG: hypothetical protein R3D27_09930 [Hyphomicrobiaceae bacterium]